MKSNNQGFTIIELMIAVAIIGVLAAIAVPAYSNYINRAKVSEALTFAATAKTAVAETYQSNGSFPTSNAQAGLAATINSTNVGSVSVGSNGVIAIATSISGLTTQATLSLSPTSTSSGITWNCTSSGNTAVVPANCR
jgi:type IV pilus assembly protein PilA